jgi:hypothetical protein
VQLASGHRVAVDEGRDFLKVVPGVLLVLAPFLVEISAGNDLTDCPDIEVKGQADGFRR